jgi:hypothetical protein
MQAQLTIANTTPQAHPQQLDELLLSQRVPSTGIRRYFLKGATVLLGNYPQGVDDARNIKDDAEYDIDNKIFAKALFDEHCNKGDDDRQDDEQNADLFLCHGLISFFSEPFAESPAPQLPGPPLLITH